MTAAIITFLFNTGFTFFFTFRQTFVLTVHMIRMINKDNQFPLRNPTAFDHVFWPLAPSWPGAPVFAADESFAETAPPPAFAADEPAFGADELLIALVGLVSVGESDNERHPDITSPNTTRTINPKRLYALFILL